MISATTKQDAEMRPFYDKDFLYFLHFIIIPYDFKLNSAFYIISSNTMTLCNKTRETVHPLVFCSLRVFLQASETFKVKKPVLMRYCFMAEMGKQKEPWNEVE